MTETLYCIRRHSCWCPAASWPADSSGSSEEHVVKGRGRGRTAPPPFVPVALERFARYLQVCEMVGHNAYSKDISTRPDSSNA